MKRLVSLLVLAGLLLPMPVRAQISTDFDPVEKKLRTPMTTEEKLSEDFKAGEPGKPGAKPEEKSNWWKWALGILIVGGIAAAAGGGGGGGDGGGGGGSSTGTISGSW